MVFYTGKKNSSISVLEIFENTNHIEEFIEKPFNLKTGPLYRFGIFQISENKYDFIIISHYVVINDSVYKEFLALISEYYSNDKILSTNATGQNEKIDKFNSILWDQLKSIDQNDASRFWYRILSNAKPKNNLPYFHSNNKGVGAYNFGIEKKKLNISIPDKSQSTLYSFLASVFGFTMTQYCESSHCLIASMFSVTPITNFMYGRQSNILLLPILVNQSSTIENFLSTTIASIEDCIIDGNRAYYYLPTEDNISNSNISKLNIFFWKS